MKLKKLFGSIQKVEDQDDGTIIVEGIASSEQPDADGEVIKADAIKAAIPDYMKFGAIREMHQAKAAGTTLEISVNDANETIIKALIVDSDAIKKVKSGVYKGFSVGGSTTKRDDLNKTIITGLNLVEVSLVDRPCNPNAVITCYKADGVGGPLNKSFYSAGRLANLLEAIQDFADCVEYENQYEERNPEIPTQVRECAQQLGEALKAMVSNEVDALAKTQSSGEAKANQSEFGGISEEHIQKVVDSYLQKIAPKASPSPTDASTANDGAKDQTTQATPSDDLKKLSNDLDTTKAQLAKSEQENNDLQKRIKDLEAQPETPKAAITDLGKSHDTTQQEQEISPVLNANGEVNEFATAIKKAQQAKRI